MFDSGVKKVVVKAQVHAGGRGKGMFRETGYKGGVHIAKNSDEVEELARSMLGYHLITKQTGKLGQRVSKILLEPAVEIVEENYLAILMDRQGIKGPAIIASSHGGVNIEEVAETNPSAILKMGIDINKGVSDKQALEIVDFLGGSSPETRNDNAEQIKLLYQLFSKTDSTQIEINPLILGKDKKFRCLDAKFNFDDDAFFRQKELWALRDETQENPRDVEAEKHGLHFVELDGTVALMVNGAGLAMATVDAVKIHGANAANFLDVGGGASKEAIEQAFRLVLSDKQVESVLVNIFGGIMKCDTIANGIIAAAQSLNIKVPVVVRLEGTNADLAKSLLSEAQLGLIPADSLDEAVQLAIDHGKQHAALATKH